MPKSYNSIKAGWKNPNATENGINRHSKSYKEIKASDYDFGVNNDYIKTFVNESQGLFKNINKDIEDINYNNASAKYEQKQNELRDIRHKADTIRAYFNANKKNLDSNSYNSTIKYLNDLDSSSKNLLKGYRDSVDFMKQFSNESEYNEWKAYDKYKNIDLSDRKKIAEYRNAAETEEERSYLYWKGLETFSEDELKQREKELKLTNDYESAQDIHTAYLYKKKDRLSNIPLYVNGAETNAYQALEDAYNLENEVSAQYAELEKLGKAHAGHTTEEFKQKQKEYTETQEKLNTLNKVIEENNLKEEKDALAVIFGDYSKVGRTSFTSRLGSAGDFLIDYYLTSSGNYQRAESALRSAHSSNPDYVPTRDEVLDYLGIGRNNPITAFHKQENARLAYETTIAEENAKAANLDTKYGDIWAGAVSELPNAAFSFAYGALNNAAKKGVDLVASSAYNNSSVLGKAGITMRNMLKNPQYWTSFFEEVGGNYEEALENGANRDAAVITATITSLINSVIEIGADGMSGIQGLPQELLSGNKSIIASWAESMLEEGKEEVLQGIVQNLIAKVSYDHDKPLVGVNGEAVLDPYRALEEFGMGAAVGGILGGGQILGTAALSGGINALGNSELRKYGENIRKTEGAAEQLIQFAQAHPEYKATANILSKINTDNVSDVQLGKIYASVWSDVENTVKSLKSDSEKAQYLEALYINNGNSPIIASAAVGIATNLDNQKAERTKAASKKYAEKSQAVRNAVFSEKATDSDIKNILLDNDTIEEFEDITGKKIQGKTTAEQESIVRDFLETRDIARLPYKENANIAVRNFDTGEDVVIRGIKKKSNSEVIFETSAGDMSYGDISMPSSLATVIKDATSKYGIDTANSFLRHLTDTDMNPAQYAANFSAIYNIGRATDTSFEEVSKEFPSAVKNMGESAARAAFNRGRADIVTQKQETPNVTTETRGRYTNESDSKAPFSPEVYESVAKKTGIDIHRIEEESPVRGHFNVNMLSMLINADNSNEFSTLVHELGEYGEALNYEGMKQVQDNVIKWYLKQNENGISLDKYIKQYQAAYEQKTKSTVSYEEAVKEITNDAIAGLFNTDGGIKQFVMWVHTDSGLSVSEQKTLLQKIKDILNAIALKLREWVKGKDFTGSESMLLEMEANEAAKLRSQFLKAIDDATANLQTIKNTDTENVSAENGAYSIKVTTDNSPVVVVEENILDGVSSDDYVKTVKNIISTKFSGGIPISGRLIKVNSITKSEYTNSKYSKKLRGTDGTIYVDKFKAANNLDEIILASTNYINEDLKHKRKDNFKYFARGDVLFDIGGNKYKAKVIIGTTATDSMVLYDVVQFKPATFAIKNETLRKAAISTNTEEATDTGFRYNAIITEKNSVVNRDYMQNEKNNSKVQEKFSLKLPVEETKDLIAVHNLTQEELLKTLKLGGFPMPSVAIVKAQNGHNEFGDVSVIFDKNTIDPSKSGNKVYGGDVLTPTFPDVDYEINLENAVKTMLSEESKSNGMFSVSGVWAAAAKRYNSISEIKEDSSRLKNLSQKEFETIRDGFGKRLNEIADSITDTKIKNPLIARQSAMSQIVDAINTSRTKSGMLRALQQYNPKATEMTVQDIIDLVNDISNMPTEYFEAKPRRAVGLDEIKAILIPSNAGEDLKTALSDYNTVEYEAENSEDRISKLNSLNDLKFSLAVDSRKKAKYNEFDTNAMQWANATERTDGDKRLLYNPKTDEWCLIVAGREYDGGYGVLEYYNDYNDIPEIRKEIKNDYEANKGNIESDDSITQGNGDIGDGRRGRNSGVLYGGKTSETSKVVGGEPERGGAADIQRGGSNSDGRNVNYSISVDNVSDSRADIVSNEKYQKLVKDLKRKYQYAKEEIYKTKGKKIDRVAVKSTIKDIARFYNSKIDVEIFTDRLTDIYNRMVKDKNLTPDSYKYEIEALARDIIDESKRFTEVSEHSKKILRDIKVIAIYFSEADQKEAAYIADSFKNYRNNLMGSVIIATKDTYAMDVNSWAEQMISKYPELRMFFPDGTITSGDVVAALPDIIDSLRNTYQADMEGLDYESEVEMTTLELLDGFAEIPRRQTFADKKDSELKQRIKEVRAEEKEKFEKRVEKVIEKERAAKKESKQKVYDKKNEQLARQKAFYQERAKRNAEARRESDERKRLVPRIYKTVKNMAEMLNKPTDNSHIPEVLRTTVGGVLSQIELLENGRDYSTLSVRDKTLYTELEKMKSKIASIEKAQMGKEDKDGNIDYDNSDFELDLPDGFSNEVDNLAKRVQAYIQKDEHFTLHTMSNEDLANLDYILTIMKHSVSQINRMYKNARYSHIEELGNTTINDITSYGNQKKFTDNFAGGWLKWKNATPVYAFERFGEAGNSVFKEIANGWGKLARNARSVIDFSEETWTPKEYNDWKEEVHEVRLHDGKTIKMNTPQIMSLYLLNQREQARKHIYGGGVVFIDGGKGKNGVTTNMTIDDVVKITSKLSKRQIEVANAIQNQMSTKGSDWGNEISMTRFGYKFFTEPHYFPISVDENSRNILQSNSMKSTDIFRLLNMGATKGVNEKANAPIDIFDVFDVFADHMSDMAKYNALALPILDTIKWINYKTRIPLSEGGFKMKSVREAMDTAYGKDAQKYVIRFLKDLNGVKEGGSDVDSFAGRVFSNVKVAKVGANLRVALLQPTSYVRAGYVLSAKSLAMGLNAAVRDGKKLYQEALNKSGLALWKDQGFYDTNINRSMRSMIKNDAGIVDTIKEKSMILAEWGDKATWTALWGACRWEVLHQNPDIKLNSQEFYAKVSDLFDEAILKTQVMDSTITRSELMRDSGYFAKTITAFGSENAVSYNMLMNGLSEFSRLKGQGASKKVLIGSLNVAGKGLLYYLLNNAISAVVESFFDWERDEDKDEKFSETWWENFALNNSILLKIPFVKEIVGPLYANTVGIGYSSTSETGAEIGDDIMAVARAVQKIYKSVTSGKEEISPYGVAYILGNLASDVTGIPITPAMREAVSAYNTAVSSMGKDEWIIRKSPVTASTRVRNAVNKGYDYFVSHIKDIIEYKKTEMYYNLLGKDFTEDYARRNSTDEDAKKSIRSTLTSIFKAEYVTASSSRRSEIKRMMRASGVYDDVSKTVNDWLDKYAETEKYKR